MGTPKYPKYPYGLIFWYKINFFLKALPLAPMYPKYPYGLIFRYKINFYLRAPLCPPSYPLVLISM